MTTIYTQTPTDTKKVVQTTTTTEEMVPVVPVTQTVVSEPTTVVTTTDTYLTDKLIRIIWFFITLLALLIGLRIMLGLLGANYTGFVQFVYALTEPFVAPFRGIFNSPRVNRSYFDTAAFVAMFVWPLIGWGITEVIRILDDRT